MKIGYIVRYGQRETGFKFRFRESSCKRVITSRGDRIYSKMLYPLDYTDVKDNTDMMRREGIILVQEPFFLDDELREKAVRWVEYANNADPKEYDPFVLKKVEAIIDAKEPEDEQT